MADRPCHLADLKPGVLIRYGPAGCQMPAHYEVVSTDPKNPANVIIRNIATPEVMQSVRRSRLTDGWVERGVTFRVEVIDCTCTDTELAAWLKGASS